MALVVNYLGVGLIAIPQVLVVVACVLHHRDSRSKVSVALLIGATGQLLSYLVFEALGLGAIGLFRPNTAATAIGIAGGAGTLFSLVFGISLLLVFRARQSPT
jgi:hypothetical protein